ncbi:MAG: SUMF1/EgtB/PvdO family nonheme iron enzyme, partial [bacterium]
VMDGVIAELNRGVAHERHVVLELSHWKTDAYPGFHPEGPQGVIDPILKIEDCDILLAIFWKRFGTPAKGAASGAEHEIRTAIKARQSAGRPQIMIYFKEAARDLKMPEELRQYAAVLEFKQEISPLGLFWSFEDAADFERKVRQHLTHYILDHIHPIAGEPAAVNSANRLQELIRSHRRNLQQKFSTIHLFGEKRRRVENRSAVFQTAADKMSALPRVSEELRRTTDAGDMADIERGFVPLHLQDWRDENSPPTTPLDIDNVFFNDGPPRHFLLRGLPGSGKTTLLRYLSHRYAGSNSDCIPVYMRCKSLDLSETTLENFVQQQLNEDSDSPEIFEALCAKERFLEKHTVLLFDGLDEIEHAETGNRIAVELEKLARKYPRTKIIAAARPLAVRLSDFAKFRRLDVLALTPEMIRSYVERWFANEPEKIAALEQSLAQRPRIRDLAANPFLLSMICFTFEQGGDAALLERRSDLYEKCTQYLLQRAYDPESSAAAKSNYEHTIEILKDVSLRFFLWKEDDFPVDHVNVMGRRALSAETLGRPEDLLNRLEAETGLIQRAKEGFAFVHRSLWEYFTALALRDKTHDFVIRHAANPDWEEVVRLYAGLLPNHDKVVELVNGLWNLNRPLALRVTTEVKTPPAAELLNPLIKKEEGNQSKLLLIDSLEQSLRLIAATDRQKLVQETLDILLIKCEERDCEVIYHAQELLEKIGLQPLQPDGLIYELFDLAHAAERQKQFLADPANHFEWIEVEGGEFWMGDDEHVDNEKPAHRVKVGSFHMAKHPVTNRLFSNFPFGLKIPNSGGESHPAIGNTWWEAYYFVLWVDASLPTEAEWEYAARGGKQAQCTQYYFGDAAEELSKHAWYGENVRRHPHAVDEVNPRTGKENLNPLGLANMLGNVAEWCQDWYDNYKTSANKNEVVENPRGPKTGTAKILRGTSFLGSSYAQRCACRLDFQPYIRYIGGGFRLVRRASRL